MPTPAREAIRLELEHVRREEDRAEYISWAIMPIDAELVDEMYLMVAYLARNSGHGWDEALALPLRELSRRFDALVTLIRREKDAVKS
ncbi:MAG: hypothetical protein U5L04_01690 [Trueperaceae bacterium]|nr:hypothetical protein [Trueperaceae bacterium]